MLYSNAKTFAQICVESYPVPAAHLYFFKLRFPPHCFSFSFSLLNECAFLKRIKQRPFDN